MDAATLSAAAAAIPTSRSARNAASAALAIAVDDSKSNLRTLKTLATALQTALGLAGYLPALISAGERMLIYDELHKEWIEAMDAVIDDDSDEQRHHKVYTMEIALQLASEAHACREYGPQQSAMISKLDQVNAFGPRLRIFPVCRAEGTTNEHLHKQKRSAASPYPPGYGIGQTQTISDLLAKSTGQRA